MMIIALFYSTKMSYFASQSLWLSEAFLFVLLNLHHMRVVYFTTFYIRNLYLKCIPVVAEVKTLDIKNFQETHRDDSSLQRVLLTCQLCLAGYSMPADEMKRKDCNWLLMECFRFFFAKSILSYFYDLLGIYITCMWSEFLTVKKYKSFIYTRKCIFRLIFYPCFQQIIHNISLHN